ncbi:type VII secretion-associated serine protease mycosin [Aeromicrobium panaciterrae]|uniref:Type VII secretion-associated serine protease mycosin n=1 Tax=Aeromicrobium panaciterrae TaxID=363861 RepID=A0ABU1ULI0_9ACTN|nr:S8 family serine peptidase [Aeromicrobium panaciterrae]MDR7086039.1 type VII secretion-associated serine protease mycosin [Aeromicrobium panaciterrae]
MHLTRTFKTVCRRVAVAGVVVSTLVAATGASAQADPVSDLLAQARSILATATSADPLKVVITTDTGGAPSISSVRATSGANALELIVAALKKPSTIGVDMAHPVKMAASNDPYRKYQWGLDLFNAESRWKTSKGTGVVVAVVDTGVSASHPDFKGRVLSGRDFIAPGTSANDANGHGTHVAGIIAANANNDVGGAGLAPRVKILPVRVLDATGEGDNAGVASGIIWAAKKGAKVINLSLGSTQNDTAIKEAVSYAQSLNVVVIAAAGNEGCGLLGTPTSYPAAYPGVLGVGAISKDRTVASYSSCGSWVDVVAPGSAIVSTMISSANSDLGCTPGKRYCTLSGTSMATPFVAATAALEIARLGGHFSQASIISRLQSTATDLGRSGRDNDYGYGLISPSRMLAGAN